MGKSAIGTN
uniref:Uncharacterized protein n=1 Tax=Anguilla anguilla TaxID=7936 RepID=A0A0E9Q0U5_ANGAN